MAKDALAILLGKPMEKGEESEAGKEDDNLDVAREDAGVQLKEALDSEDGMAIYEAVCDILRLRNK